MTRKFSVPYLRYHVQTVIGKSIFNFFKTQHKDCVECRRLKIPGEVCKTLTAFRESLEKIPMYAFRPLFGTVFSYSTSSGNDGYHLMYTTLNFFFPFKLFRSCKIQIENTELITRFGKDLEILHISNWNIGHKWPVTVGPSANRTQNTMLLTDMIQMTPTLRIINLHYQEIQARCFLVALSRNCHNIRELQQICFTGDISEYITQLFCYKDWPQKTEKNKCCESIQVFDIYRKFQHANPTISEVKGLRVLCENLSNLNSLGDMFPVQKVLSIMTAAKFHDEKFRNSLLTLKAASFDDTFVEGGFISNLKEFTNLEHLHIKNRNSHLNFSIADVISFAGNLADLVHLELELAEEVNISMICTECPNLTKLGLRINVPGNVIVSRGSCATFNNLHYFWICASTNIDINYDWLRAVSPNVQVMCIAVRIADLSEKPLLESFEKCTFPKLQSIHIVKHNLTADGLKSLLSHCPKLDTVASEFRNIDLLNMKTELKDEYGKCFLYRLGNSCCFFSNEMVHYQGGWSVSNMSDCC